MSIAVEYYFNSEASLPEVTNLVNRVLGCHLEPYEGDASDLFCRLLSMETSLIAEHDLVDEHELNFSDYRYELSIRTPWGDSDLRELQVGLMAMLPSLLRRRAGITSGMLVYDGQRLLARYEVRDEQFFDMVCGKAVVFPAHVQDVFARIRRA